MSAITSPTEESGQAPPEKQWFVNAFVAVIVLVNLYILWWAWEDKSWGALWLAIIGGPIANGVLLLTGVFTIVFRQAVGWRTSAFGGAAMATFPIVGIVVDAVAIFCMDLSGC